MELRDKMAHKKKPSVVYWLGENLYINITNNCPNNCYFCLRNFKEGVGSFNLKLEREPSTAEIIAEIEGVINKRNWREIVFCGFGEPFERLDCMLEVCRWIKRHYGKIVTLRVDTNGQAFLLNKGREVVKELKTAGMDKVSVSLNAHNKETYNQVCRPTFENAFESVLEFIEKAKELLEVEVTAVRIPEVDIQAVEEITRKMGVKFRVRDYIQPFW
ncbi:MAG: TatD family nuclease-associated radical SAM protein [Candidatus Bathyarchaeia archaeon]|nr:TatD family nuclease-associated radical SAM protein [Candidatus Bathyarchaeota archaeon]